MKNCICLAKRKVAKELANNLINSILWDKDWNLQGTNYGSCIRRENIEITIKPGPLFGIREILRVFHNGNKLWFPILQRMRIRCAVRLRLLWEAQKVV